MHYGKLTIIHDIVKIKKNINNYDQHFLTIILDILFFFKCAHSIFLDQKLYFKERRFEILLGQVL